MKWNRFAAQPSSYPSGKNWKFVDYDDGPSTTHCNQCIECYVNPLAAGLSLIDLLLANSGTGCWRPDGPNAVRSIQFTLTRTAHWTLKLTRGWAPTQATHPLVIVAVSDLSLPKRQIYSRQPAGQNLCINSWIDVYMYVLLYVRGGKREVEGQVK